MSNPTIDRLTEELKERHEFATGLLNAAEEEGRQLNDTDVENIKLAEQRSKEIQAQLDQLVSFEEQRSSAAALTKRVKAAEKGREIAVEQTREIAPMGGFRSLGDAFVQSDEFRSANGGVMRDRFHAELSAKQVRDAAGLEGEPVNSSEPVGSYLIPRPGRVVKDGPAANFPLYDSVSHVSVNVGSLDIIIQGSPEGAVTPEWVKEASSTEDGAKPFTELVATQETVVLEIAAGLIDVTRQMLQLGGAAVRQFIDRELTKGLINLIEQKVADLITAATVPEVDGADWNVVIRSAIAEAQANGYTPTHLLASPATAAEIDLNMMSLLGGLTAVQMNSNPYGLQLVVSNKIPDDVIYVADLDEAVTIYERTGIETFITDSDSFADGRSKFQRNIMTILAETSCAPVVGNPAALVRGAITVTP